MVPHPRCRTCLSEGEETISIKNSISFDEYNTVLSICIIDLIEECASVEILLGDAKPQDICQICVQNAKISYTFRKRCERSQILLAEEFVQFQTIKVENENFSSEDEKPLSEIKPKIKTQNSISFSSRNESTTTESNEIAATIHKGYECSSEIVSSTDIREKKHVCNICFKGFTLRRYFIKHIKAHAERSLKNVVYLEDEHYASESNSNNSQHNSTIDSGEIGNGEQEIASSIVYSMIGNEQNSERLCRKCDKKCISRKEWMDHMKSHRSTVRKGKRRVCPECDAVFDSNDEWLRHIRMHTTFKCQQCGISVDNMSDLKSHMALIHSGRTTKSLKHRTCDICSKAYLTRESMTKHKLVIHGEYEAKQLPEGSCCDYCSWTGTSAELAKHKMAEHAHLRQMKCKQCEKAFFTNNSLRLHMLVHTGEKKHMCEICGSSFALQTNLIIHKRVHTGERPYKCDQCDKAFTQHSSLHIHKFTHTEEPTFACDQCGKTFFRKDSLRYHMKKHRSIEEWDKCELCDKKFKTRKLLRNHMVVHTGERNHICTVCDKGFGRRSSLRTHMKIHTGEKPHVCSICGRAFLQKHVLISHMKTHGGK